MRTSQEDYVHEVKAKPAIVLMLCTCIKLQEPDATADLIADHRNFHRPSKDVPGWQSQVDLSAEINFNHPIKLCCTHILLNFL